MKLKIIIVLLIAALMHFSNPLISMADEFYVETDGSDDDDGSESSPWRTIQGAIDKSAVDDGDTIYIGSGTFNENITVDKSIEIYGDEDENPLITAKNSGVHVFTIACDDVEVKNLTITGTKGAEDIAGVYVDSGTDDFSISYCELQNNEHGIYLYKTDGTVISNNEFEDNYMGIHLDEADDSKITYNDFKDNTLGIYLDQSEIANIYSNDFEDGDYGIFLEREDDDDDDEYYDAGDVSQLKDDNDFNDMEKADVYLGEEDEVEDDSCFIKTISFGL
jgi:parallel beta-helix repeat protein